MQTIEKTHMGKTLSIVLASLDLSQATLARRMKRGRQRVSQLCAAEHWHNRTVYLVAKALKVPVETFLK